ncbi:GNAT family N-acetyltransferase [Streptantibioticus rubrisoli]|uniref:Dipeptide epimerase n=1 Tax=Streptantibioticus rubrisoli TaxID=1387313 RepID=A0ABT1P7E1_9ACTN|nr:GNAT family N-acetyltransferase [Streptantibioticus rubrisoli]MCQ4041301.1 GNAT family N-acetyltransferase [Streptantibioticus rubrisoli]
MKATVHEVSLTQRHVWRSAREAIPVQPGVVVELAQDGASGFGEASAFMTHRYNSDLDRLHADLRRIAPVLAELGPGDPWAVWQLLAAELPESPFVLAALDSAVHDLRARLLGVPLWRSLGLAEPRGLRSSYSIGLDEPAAMARKLGERPGWHAYKVKLADPADLTILKELRQHTDAPFYVDGNCGWELDRTLPALEHMRELGVELVEQPFPREAWADARTLKRHSPLPVLADESITSPADLDPCTEAFHGINVKPMKAGGITPALAMLRTARERGLITMLGCMYESAAGVTATAHLGGLADHLDVDVVDLLAVDTGRGLALDGVGRVSLPDRPGSGYLPDPSAHGWRVRAVPVEEVRPIRHQVLRPGQPASSCAYPEDGDPGVRHFAALAAGETVGAASLYPQDPPAPHTVAGLPPGRGWRLRGMATVETVRGTGAGSALLRTALTHAALAGAGAVWCNARSSAADFYRRHGFQVLGEEFDMPGIGPHWFMYWSPR